MGTKVKPYGKADSTKKEEVAEMFDNISKALRFSESFFITWNRQDLETKSNPHFIKITAKSYFRYCNRNWRLCYCGFEIKTNQSSWT
jgi:hypothetical protein